MVLVCGRVAQKLPILGLSIENFPQELDVIADTGFNGPLLVGPVLAADLLQFGALQYVANTIMSANHVPDIYGISGSTQPKLAMVRLRIGSSLVDGIADVYVIDRDIEVNGTHFALLGTLLLTFGSFYIDAAQAVWDVT